jgi:hypothetical protein
MSLIRLSKMPSRRELAWFGVLWLVFFGTVGAVLLWHGRPLILAAGVWLAAVLVPVMGWLVPGLMRLIYLGMWFAGFPVGFVLSYALLAAVYYFVLTPVGLLLRIVGRDPMHRRFDAQADSYWVPRKPDDDIDRYFRQW